MKNILFALFFVLSTLYTSAQQLPVYSQYMLSSFLLNPAVAGHEGYTSINLTAREQWLGEINGPSTYAVSAQTRLLKNSYIMRSSSIRKRARMQSRSGRVGMGLYLYNDKRGVFNNLGLQYTYAYHLSLRRSQVSLGASVNMYQFAIDQEKINQASSELVKNFNRNKKLIPDANFGVYFTNRNLYAGISMNQLFQNQIQFGEQLPGDLEISRVAYIMSGYRFDLIDFVFIEPSFLWKASLRKKAGSQLDTNIKFYFKEDYWAGISYRTGGSLNIDPVYGSQRGSAIILMAGVRVDKYFFGYAFDYTMSSLARYTMGSHELMIAAKFGDNARRYRWLNRY